jgi:hypothetical protein
MVKRYVKMVEHLRKVVSTPQRVWDERLLIFPLAYRALTHETTGITPAKMVFGRRLRLPCDLLFGAPLDKEESTTDSAANLSVRQHLKVASDRMKTRYDRLANSAGFQEGDRVWLYHQTRKTEKSPNL